MHRAGSSSGGNELSAGFRPTSRPRRKDTRTEVLPRLCSSLTEFKSCQRSGLSHVVLGGEEFTERGEIFWGFTQTYRRCHLTQLQLPRKFHISATPSSGWQADTKTSQKKEPEKEGETAATAAICVIKCQRRGEAGGWRFYCGSGGLGRRLESGGDRPVSAEVFVKAHSLSDGGGKQRAPEAGRGDREQINGAAGDHPTARHGAHTHTALAAFCCSLYLSLTPFYFHSPTNT